MKKVRYAVIGAGWISQEAFMPSVAQTGNSEIAAIVSGNLDKAKALADFHAVPALYGYDQYDAMLASGTIDAVYIALPNSQHADYAIRAAKAGVHAMVEKPLAVSVPECEAMIAAADQAGVWLMTAYRLHTEPGTVAALDLVRSGAIGEPRMVSSTFCFQSGPRNHRLLAEHWGGPLQDLGVYCINAARHIFESEPVEVPATTGRGDGDARFAEVEETFAATLRFPGGRIANFFASFGAELAESYSIFGTNGRLEVSPRLPLRDRAPAPLNCGRQDDGAAVSEGRQFQRPDGLLLRLHPQSRAARSRRRGRPGRCGYHARAGRGGTYRSVPTCGVAGPQATSWRRHIAPISVCRAALAGTIIPG